MAETTNIAIPRGSKYTLLFRNTPAGVLPGSTIKFTVSRNPDSATKLIGPKDCSAPNGSGEYICVLTSEDTDISHGKYFWDTRIVDEGNETLLASGLFVITPIAQLP